MSTILKVNEIEKDTEKFAKPSDVSDIIKFMHKKEIPEEILIYLLEIKNNDKKIEKIEKFDNIRDKSIRGTEIKRFDKKDVQARRKMCEIFGIKYENKISYHSFSETKGILSQYINAKIDPVDIVDDIRKS